jgi:hypothetical protein
MKSKQTKTNKIRLHPKRKRNPKIFENNWKMFPSYESEFYTTHTESAHKQESQPKACPLVSLSLSRRL